jgi:uncharacterized membrane protein YcaP (DUF421 family)
MGLSAFFDDWPGVVRVVVVGIAAYAAVVAVLRTSGKRTLAKMNAFDLVVTVALGSTLATILLSRDVALAEGVVALAVLAGLQFAVAWLVVRSRGFASMVRSSPSALLSDGRLDEEALRRQRVTAADVRQAVRAQGIGSLADVGLVVLETDGSLSVVPRSGLGDGSAVVDVRMEAERTGRYTRGGPGRAR